MRILTFTSLYPNSLRPSHGIFVETRLRHLIATEQVASKVLAPVPWFPFRSSRFGEYAVHARTARSEFRNGIEVVYPRYPLLPRVGMSVAPLSMALGVWPTVRRVAREFPFDLIDAHYLYPDGVAAILVGKRLGKPVVITARGTDVSLIPRHRLPRAWILWAARHSAGVVAVSGALKEGLTAIGVPPDRITVLRNGVDLQLFNPQDRSPIRRRLGFRRFTLLSVGHLIPRKAHDLVIRALAALPGLDLVIVGNGPEHAALASLTNELRLSDRVRFVEALPQNELAHYYAGADALVLASSREGWANVLLEALACGTPVIASNVGSAPDLITTPEAGVLVRGRTPEEFARAIERLIANYPDRTATRRYAEKYDWAPTTEGQLELFARVLATRGPSSHMQVVGTA